MITKVREVQLLPEAEDIFMSEGEAGEDTRVGTVGVVTRKALTTGTKSICNKVVKAPKKGKFPDRVVWDIEDSIHTTTSTAVTLDVTGVGT